ncbi:MAG TPA: hypothetical protein PKO06_22045, partial [Candidatus Ozemobacteraceae bacterium]|nr:hypothetical protein [Candidatus Ozemobacteraceae bacterium]
MENLFNSLNSLEPHVIIGVSLPLVFVAIWFVRRRRVQTLATVEDHWAKTQATILEHSKRPIPEGETRNQLVLTLRSLQSQPERVLVDAGYAAAATGLLLRLNQPVEAEKLLKQAQQKYPGSPAWQDLEIDLLVAKRAADAKSVDRLCDACKRRPDQVEWHKRLVAWHVAGGQPNPKTLDVLQAWGINTKDTRALQIVCEHHDRAKAYTKRLLPLFEAACQVERDKVRWLYALARCRHHAGDQEGAREALSQVLRLEPRHQAALEFQSLLIGPPPTATVSTISPSPAPTTTATVVSAGEPFTLPERYTDVVEIGRGGMGTVYRAFDQILSRPVAIKSLHESLAQQEGLRERFLAESRTLAALDHPCIPKVFDVSVNAPSFIA